MPSIKDARRTQSDDSPEQRMLETLRSGLRSRDAALLASLYHKGVEFRIVNRNNPPSRPLVLNGRDAVRRMLEDLCAREMTHEVIRSVAGADSIAYGIECRYPDGCQVIGLNLATVKDGLIVSEISVDCWDE